MIRPVAAALLLAAAIAYPPAKAADRRIPVDPDAPPWDAVAKVQSNIGRRCSGVLIAPALVLTAAHCLYNPRTRAMLQPLSLHVLFGYRRGEYRWHRLVAQVEIGAGFDGRKPMPQAADWARLTLDAAVPATPLPPATQKPRPGTALAFAGYNQDRAQLLMVDRDCHVLQVTRLPAGGAWLRHDCAGTYGTSGGPLLIRQGEGWAVAAIAIAAGRAGQHANLALTPPSGP
ncbi:MAG: trypsin-like serine peptidase [Thiohalocapsa sp.]